MITTQNSFRFGSFSLLIYTHGAHWAAFLIIDQFLHHHHHKSRLQGYLEFYVKTKNIRRAPFYILSIGNAVLMIVVMILHDICNRSSDCSHNFSKVKFLFYLDQGHTIYNNQKHQTTNFGSNSVGKGYCVANFLGKQHLKLHNLL